MFGCTNRETKKEVLELKNDKDSSFIISAIDAEFPLKLDEIDFDSKDKTILLNELISTKIEETINEYEEFISKIESTTLEPESDFDLENKAQQKDTYINTIRLQDSMHTIFLVLLKHYPTNLVNSKALFYNEKEKEFVESSFDFNIHALYDFDNGRIIASNLKTELKINEAEIEVVDFDKNGVADYKFVRLWHNGTYNALHTTILTVNKNTLDTLFISEEPIRK
jgi:hypothetical protein